VILALSDGEPGRLIDLWEYTSLAVVIDARRDSRASRAHPQLAVDALAGVADGAVSSHGIGLGDTVELDRELTPPRESSGYASHHLPLGKRFKIFFRTDRGFTHQPVLLVTRWRR
jgi:hypothetical protein